jgi:hypothetical protein
LTFLKDPIYWQIVVVFQFVVLMQAIAANIDGWFLPSDLRKRGLKGFALVQHGGWIGDAIVSFFLAYILYHYHGYSPIADTVVVTMVMLATFVLMQVWRMQAAKGIPEAHTHDNRTTIAGWLHGAYFAAGIILLVHYFFVVPVSEGNNVESIVIAAYFAGHIVLGAHKFSKEYHWDPYAFGAVALAWVILGCGVWRRLQ